MIVQRKISWMAEIFDPKYVKRDFARFAKLKKELPSVFWFLIIYVAMNIIGLLGVFLYYVVSAIIQVKAG